MDLQDLDNGYYETPPTMNWLTNFLSAYFIHWHSVLRQLDFEIIPRSDDYMLWLATLHAAFPKLYPHLYEMTQSSVQGADPVRSTPPIYQPLKDVADGA